MDGAVFTKECLRTESPTTPELEQRLRSYAPRIQSLLLKAIDLGDELDGLKRAVFYNKTDRLRPADSVVAPVESVARMVANARAVHGLMGMLTEIGEIASAYANFWLGHTPGLDRVNVIEECGDVVYYPPLLLDSLGSDLGEAMVAVNQKLRNRYPDKFTEHDAVERDLRAERRTLESSIDGETTF